MHSSSRVLPPAFLLSLLLAGCGGGGGGGSSGSGATRLDQALRNLGVDTTSSARQGDAGQDLPATYCPFGKRWDLAKTSELLIVGLDPRTTVPPVALFDLTDSRGQAVNERLLALEAAEAPWARESRQSRSFPATLRAPVAADVDGDGREEIAVVYMASSELRVLLVDDASQGLSRTVVPVRFEADVTGLTAAAGDLDGDGRDELVVALSQRNRVSVSFLRRTGDRFDTLPQRLDFDPVLATPVMAARIACGNLDDDPAWELAVVVNEYANDVFNPIGECRFTVLDDAGTAFARLGGGLVQGLDQTQRTRTAVVADVSIGDIDGDRRGEVVFGGLTAFNRNCDAVQHLFLALDDPRAGLGPMGTFYLQQFIPNCSSANPPHVRFVHVNTLDLDGDGRAEIQANQFLFDDFAAGPWVQVPAWKLPDDVVTQQGQYNHFDVTTSSFVVGDFTGDRRADVAVCRLGMNEVAVWALDATQTQIARARTMPVSTASAQFPTNPVILPVNIDTDSPVLQYSEGEHQFVFTEPVLIAALAAPPSVAGIGQNLGACVTAFGNSTSTGTVRERSVTVSASASVGFKAGSELLQSEVELKTTATVAATRIQSRAYTLTKSILFTSGPAEDTVVFTTVPVDRYTYTILSHPDTALIGRQVVVNLPRDPITLQAERGFYNRTVQAGSLLVDQSVFTHRIGDPRSYPDQSRKNALLGSNRGLQIGPISVGQGTGQTELTLQVGQEMSAGRTLEIGFETSLEVTGGGVLGGVSFGASAASTFTVTSGASTTYTGVVGAIPADRFPQHRYQFGLFTYVHRDARTGRQFQVLDYWVQ